jgi:hypothetical protein
MAVQQLDSDTHSIGTGQDRRLGVTDTGKRWHPIKPTQDTTKTRREKGVDSASNASPPLIASNNEVNILTQPTFGQMRARQRSPAEEEDLVGEILAQQSQEVRDQMGVALLQ